MTAFVLVHSPLLGPSSWQGVSDTLAADGHIALSPDLDELRPREGPYWKRHVDAVVRAMAATGIAGSAILVGHSGAGRLLPAIGSAWGEGVGGYLFVDAGLPDPSHPRKGTGEFARHLDRLHAASGRYPDWSDEALRASVPDPALREAILADVRAQAPEFWEEVVPIPSGWPDAPCAYLRFRTNPAYEQDAREAARRGWPVREIVGGHFHLVVEPKVVADNLLTLARGLLRVR